MRKLVVLTGVRGAGKTTLVNWLQNERMAGALKPFTTRPKRSRTESEYHFYPRARPPKSEEVAWQIAVGGDKYGMLLSEVDAIDPAVPSVTVFDPDSLEELHRFRIGRPDIEVIIVGLDTIHSIDEQHARVGNDQKRMVDQATIENTREILKAQDITLTGDLDTIKNALKAVMQLISGRGGVISKDVLLPLCRSGALLDNFDESNIQAASYDLRVGHEMWCQGQFIDLDGKDDRFSVPPYSYIIVKAMEQVTMPAFMSGTFDIKVSHFFSGLILSNGPQVDPGYRGDLFCMLFNGNSAPRTLVLKEHFATIEFSTVTTNSPRYVGPYSFRDKLRSAMPIGTASGPGGAIFGRIDEKVGQVRKEMNQHNLVLLGAAGILSAVALAAAAFAFTASADAFARAREAKDATSELSRIHTLLEDKLKELQTERSVVSPAQHPRLRPPTSPVSREDGSTATAVPQLPTQEPAD